MFYANYFISITDFLFLLQDNHSFLHFPKVDFWLTPTSGTYVSTWEINLNPPPATHFTYKKVIYLSLFFFVMQSRWSTTNFDSLRVFVVLSAPPRPLVRPLHLLGTNVLCRATEGDGMRIYGTTT